jgi:predicted GIY-YIG superfamily endonuclease
VTVYAHAHPLPDGRRIEHATLYRLFDASGVLLYVGISGRWATRLAQHAARQGWWDEVAKVTREPFESREDALAAEAAAIKREHPRYNVRGKPQPRPPTAQAPVYWMPTLPPSRPGEPGQVLWIEGITSKQAAIELLLRVSGSLDHRGCCEGCGQWGRRVEFTRTPQGELSWRCEPCRARAALTV